MAKPAAKSATPRLRFPEFRGGKEWSTERMDRIYSFGRNNVLSRDKLNYVHGAAKNIHYGDIHTKYPSAFDVSRERVPFVNRGEALPDFASGDYCVESDLVFADASEDLNDVGKTLEIVRLHGERVLAGQHTILARQLKRTFVTGFGAHLFGSGLMRGRIRKEAQGTKVYQISAARLGGIDITYPGDEAEQQKITDCLTSLDEVIAARGRKVEALKAHKRGLMQQLFPREGETRPRLRFPEFRNAPQWNKIRLGDVVEVASGQVNPTESPYRDMLHVGGENIEGETGNIFGLRSAREDGVISGKYLFNEGDILYSKIRPILNKVAAPGFRGICSADIYPLRPASSDVSRCFLLYLLRSASFVEYATEHSERGKIPKINREALLGYGARLPGAAEQQRIADCLASLDTRISAEADQLATLKTHKQGLMQQLFPAPEAMRV